MLVTKLKEKVQVEHVNFLVKHLTSDFVSNPQNQEHATIDDSTEPLDLEPISTIHPNTNLEPSTEPPTEPSENNPSDEENIQLTQNPKSNNDGTVTPNPTIAVPSQADTPPVLFKSKKAKSFDSTKIRRSSRIMSGIGSGKKLVIDNTVHVIHNSDSENTISDSELDKIELEPLTSSKSVPAKQSPISIKKTSATAIKAPKKKLPRRKRQQDELLEVPLIHPEEEAKFEQYWKVKPVAPGRVYDFDEISKGGVNLLKYVEPLGWTKFFQMKDTIMPLLVQAFYFNSKVHPKKDLIISNIKGVEIHVTADTISNLLEVKRNGITVYGKNWYAAQFVSKDALIVEMFTDEGAHKEKPPSSMLKKEYKVLHNMCQHSIFPRTGSMDKVTDNDLLVMYHLSKGIQLDLPYLILQHMMTIVKSGIKKIALPYGMLLTRIFRDYHVDESKQILENQWFTFGTKNLNHMKKEIESGNTSTDIGSKRKRIELESNLDLLAKASGEQSENVLPTGENVDNQNIVSDSQPNILNSSLPLGSTFSHEIETTSQQAGKILQGFHSTTTPMNTSVFSPIMTSSHGSLQSMFSTDFVRNLITSNSPDPSQVPVPIFSTGSLPSLPSSFATLDSFCSSANATAAATWNMFTGFEGNFHHEAGTSTDPRPPKRTKIEKRVSKMKKDLTQLMKGMAMQNNMLMYIMLEFQIMRNWLNECVCTPLQIVPPPPNPPPPVEPFPQPENSTSSDDSSPTVPA
ncbi:hypothetical protein L195_g017892 [Trifolium pratense]|uniref:Putative plant transposon protein domain-containing protein n=1 Tax=Trifolium pratense TaxID=57577 RepID=A0A2K3MVF1_TRIPR|nr:hypothetical protein L195_g017892 [Trifolium pratense]